MTSFFSLSDLGLSGSASQLLQTWLANMQAVFPGYNPSAANLEYIQAQILASMAADLAQLCGQGSTELFRTFGTTLVGVPYQQGISAQAVINIKAQASSSVALTSAGLSAGGPITSIPVVALAYGVASGTVTISDPAAAHTQTFTTTGANQGDTSIPVSTLTPNFDYPTGSTISGTQVYVLPALSQFSLDSLGFQNLSTLTFNAGTTQNVTLLAVQSGEVFNGAGSQGAIQLVQQLNWVESTEVVAAASGGQDPEDDTHYLNRLTTALQLMAPRPITAPDYGVMALSFSPYPGTDQQPVGRATAVDGYDPNSGTFNNEREVTVCVTDANGLALNSDTMYGYPSGTAGAPVTTAQSPSSGWGVQGWLESLRELNFIVNVIAPTYSAVYVAVRVKAQTGWDGASVQQNVQLALLAYLSPSAWGLPPNSPSGWENATTLFYSTLMGTIQNAAGVAHVEENSLAFGLTANPANVNDLVLPGPVALPTSSSQTIPLVAITVT